MPYAGENLPAEALDPTATENLKGLFPLRVVGLSSSSAAGHKPLLN